MVVLSSLFPTSCCSQFKALGIEDFGNDTGCSSTAPSLKKTFHEISAWLDLPENSEELLFIKLEDYTGDNVRVIDVLFAVCCFRLLSVSVGFRLKLSSSVATRCLGSSIHLVTLVVRAPRVLSFV